MKKKAILAVALLGVLAFSYNYISTPTATFIDETGDRNARITLEVADSREERLRGLMFRETLEENHGMLFVYEREENRSFWMKNTLIPLDIIFIDSNKTIINIEEAYRETGVPDSELRRYRSERPAKYVIEVNQNFTDRNEIEVGDKVDLSQAGFP